MPGEESAVGIHSASLFLSVGIPLADLPTDFDFAPPEPCVDDYTQAHESSLLSITVAETP